MERAKNDILSLLFKIFLLSLLISPLQSAFALDEFFDLYDAPQALSMGGTQAADSRGYVANYYNPAGLAKARSRHWHADIVGLEFHPGAGGISNIVSGSTFGIYQLYDDIQNNPDSYHYHRFNLTAAVTRRNWSFTFLSSYFLAARSDGSTVDTFAGSDIGPSLGFGTNLAGNMLKVGVSVSAIVRNELNGQFAHAALGSPDAIKQQMAEGLGFPINMGLMFTLPNRYLPTFAVLWRNAMNTRFSATSLFNSQASGQDPQTIPQSFDAAFSIHPKFNWHFKTTVTFEVRHLERADVSFTKRTHIGVELENRRAMYIWAGLNQMYATLGFGLRVKGGNLEVGTYGKEVGTNPDSEQDRRFFMRYTIGF